MAQTSRGKLDRLPRTPAGFTLRALDGYGLRSPWPARPALTPRIRFLFIGSRLCSALPSDPASRRRPCASLTLCLHQAGWRTFTSELSSMLGTPRVRIAARSSPRFASRRPPRSTARGGAPALGLRRPVGRRARHLALGTLPAGGTGPSSPTLGRVCWGEYVRCLAGCVGLLRPAVLPA